ncbi:Bacterial regulatory protein, tetR family [compost metagenome]
MKKKVLTERQLKSQQVKENIHNAAIRMLKEYEYDYLTVRNVCKEANVSTGTFYHHFKNKDDNHINLLYACACKYMGVFKINTPTNCSIRG